MKKRITVDSSVFVASFLKHEARYNEAIEVMKDIFEGKTEVILLIQFWSK